MQHRLEILLYMLGYEHANIIVHGVAKVSTREANDIFYITIFYLIKYIAAKDTKLKKYKKSEEREQNSFLSNLLPMCKLFDMKFKYYFFYIT